MERNALASTLDKAWRGGITLQSDFFRKHPKKVALAASLGLITTIDPTGNYGGIWRLTPKGLSELFNIQNYLETNYEFNNLESNAMDTEASNTSIPLNHSFDDRSVRHLPTISPPETHF